MSMSGQPPLRPGGLKLTKAAAAAAGISSESSILDIGCGSGTSLAFLRQEYDCSVTGIDHSELALTAAGTNLMTSLTDCFDPDAPVNLLLADASHLPIPDASFDLIMMECTLTLFADPLAALSEAARVLRPGGWLYISALCRKNPAASDPLVENGLLHAENLREYLPSLKFKQSTISLSDQTQALIQFVADMIFRYGSLDAYIREAVAQNDGCIFNCAISPKETGYVTILAQRAV